MSSLRGVWPDDDRRDAALRRILARTNGLAFPNAPRGRGTASDGGYLSASELRALVCMSHGVGEEGAADILGVSVRTVRETLLAARRRLQARDTTHAVAEALRRSLIV